MAFCGKIFPNEQGEIISCYKLQFYRNKTIIHPGFLKMSPGQIDYIILSNMLWVRPRAPSSSMCLHREASWSVAWTTSTDSFQYDSPDSLQSNLLTHLQGSVTRHNPGRAQHPLKKCLTSCQDYNMTMFLCNNKSLIMGKLRNPFWIHTLRSKDFFSLSRMWVGR